MMKKAYTVLEVMLVVTIFAIMVGILGLYSQASQVRADLNAQTANLVSYLRLAQSDALAGKNGLNHGLHFEIDKYVVFEGNAYAEGTNTNYEIELPPTIEILNVALNGGGNDVIFNSLGETLTYGTLQLVSDQIGQYRTVEINQLGNVSY